MRNERSFAFSQCHTRRHIRAVDPQKKKKMCSIRKISFEMFFSISSLSLMARLSEQRRQTFFFFYFFRKKKHWLLNFKMPNHSWLLVVWRGERNNGIFVFIALSAPATRHTSATVSSWNHSEIRVEAEQRKEKRSFGSKTVSNYSNCFQLEAFGMNENENERNEITSVGAWRALLSSVPQKRRAKQHKMDDLS